MFSWCMPCTSALTRCVTQQPVHAKQHGCHRLNPFDLAWSGLTCRYRNQYTSDSMVAELASSQDLFAPMLLETQKRLTAEVCVCARARACVRVCEGGG